ncbi:MAG: 2-amino-4-hydroxy-6-hydroxymethyldihydropteridine diphosphokinase [Omnitrophica WOR_2 bacterium]
MSAAGKYENRAPHLISPVEHKNIFNAYIGLGSNINPIQNLVKAVELLEKSILIKTISQVWETTPSGAQGPNFLNAAAQIETQLTPSLLKSLVLRRVEVELGRVRTGNKNAPRTIDLDILVFENDLLDPKVWTHAFVAVPLSELIPQFTNPETHETLDEAALRLSAMTSLKPRPDVSLKL